MTPYMKTIFQQKKTEVLTKFNGSAPLTSLRGKLIALQQTSLPIHQFILDELHVKIIWIISYTIFCSFKILFTFLYLFFYKYISFLWKHFSYLSLCSKKVNIYIF